MGYYCYNMFIPVGYTTHFQYSVESSCLTFVGHPTKLDWTRIPK